jgi:hypothetical protein
MATKKKTKKKLMKAKKSKKTAPEKAALKTAKRPKKSVKKSAKGELAPKTAAKKKSAKKKAPASQQRRIRSGRANVTTFSARVPGSRSGEQSGDLQGLSRRESADSESVDELLEEGNAFEADAVIGVEDAGDADEGEVHTHEVPEDDVPGEYLDKD